MKVYFTIEKSKRETAPQEIILIKIEIFGKRKINKKLNARIKIE